MSVEAARLIAFDPEFKAIVEAQDWDGPDFKTCANAASVARAFETSRRREVLNFKHNAKVAALAPEQANGWSPYRRPIWSAQTARSFWARSMSATAIDFTPNNSSPRSTACVVAGTREALVALWRLARPEPPKPGRRRRLADLVDTVRVEGDVILDLRHCLEWGLVSPDRID